jgi:hypothetical protein
MTVNKPYFATVSLLCAVAALPAAKLGADLFGPADDPLGFGGMGIALGILLLILGTGLVCGLLGLWRRERPPALPAIAAAINAAGTAWLALLLPGSG